MSGTKTGCLVSATLKNHTAVREAEGLDIGGVFFSWVLHFWTSKKEVPRRLKAKPFSEKARRLKAKPFSKNTR